MTRKKITLPVMNFKLQFWLVFVLGGVLQVLGVVSKTKLTIVLAVLALLYFFADALINTRLRQPVICAFALAALAVTNLSWLVNQAPLPNLLDSLLTVLIPLAFYFSTVEFSHRTRLEKLLQLMLFISAIQLPVMLLQKVFYHQIAALARESVVYIDIACGTFFFKDDHALGFFMLCLITFALYNRKADFLIPHKKLFLAWWILTIMASHSKISFALLAVVLSIFFTRKFVAFLSMNHLWQKFFKLLLLLAFALAFTLTIMINTGRLTNEKLQEAYSVTVSRIERELPVARYGPLVKFLREPVSLLGRGPFNYYNPITKTWGIAGGHSQWYSLYCNFGLLGFLAVSALLLTMFNKIKPPTEERYWYLFMLVLFGLVTQFLLDPAILITFFFFLHTGKITAAGRQPAGNVNQVHRGRHYRLSGETA